jgi:hypothetical protein
MILIERDRVVTQMKDLPFTEPILKDDTFVAIHMSSRTGWLGSMV